MNKTITPSKEAVAQLFWTAFILMFFVMQAIIWTVAISITSNDMSHAVVSGYDEQALNWDEVKRAKFASDNLGWRAEIHIDDSPDAQSRREIVVNLADHQQAPLQSADVQLTAFHRAAAADPQRLIFQEREPGAYVSVLKVERFGKWKFSGSAKISQRELLIDQTKILPNRSRSLEAR